jgi:hypothetical protein
MDTQEQNNSDELNNLNEVNSDIIITSSDNNDTIISASTERVTLEEIYKLARKIYESA